MILAQALVFPGRHTRLRNLSLKGRDAGVIVLGAVAMLFAAGMIEGFFRQLVHDPLTRYLVAFATLVLWGVYFAFAGREKAA